MRPVSAAVFRIEATRSLRSSLTQQRTERPIYHSRLSTSRLILIVAAVGASACDRNKGASRADSASGQAAAAGSDTLALVRGAVVSASPTSVVIKVDTGNVTVHVAQPIKVYDREPGQLADIKDNSFVGVTSVKQPDGSERATEIHIFPEELRGLGEGSRMMAQNAANNGSRMTNGAVSPSRMSNGSVASATGSALVVQYAGGSQRIVVPPATTVTEIKLTAKSLTAGDQVVVVAKRGADGTLSARGALLTGR